MRKLKSIANFKKESINSLELNSISVGKVSAPAQIFSCGSLV